MPMRRSYSAGAFCSNISDSTRRLISPARAIMCSMYSSASVRLVPDESATGIRSNRTGGYREADQPGQRVKVAESRAGAKSLIFRRHRERGFGRREGKTLEATRAIST
jgi:hypothetical protein